MAELIDQPKTETTPDTDLVAEIRIVLEASSEPMTLSKIRTALPARLRSLGLEGLADVLRRQAAANVFTQYPKYRSPQDRFWDRPMPVHLAQLLRSAVAEKPLTWSDIRRKLPDYAKTLADAVLEEQVARGQLYRHPALNRRTGPRFGAHQPDPREYLRTELLRVFERLEQLGFTPAQLREGALDLLHEEEWASPPARSEEASTSPEAAALGELQPASPSAGEPALPAHPQTPAAKLPLSQP